VHILIEAFNGLDPSRARLSIYGTEKAFPEYAQRVHALAKTPNITFQGEVDHDQLWLALADVDLLVVPSLWYETFSLVIQEAFATKVPVIASNLGALREAVRHGVDGLLFPPGDPVALRRVLQELVDTPSLLDGLRDNIEPVKSMIEHAAEIETVYARLVEQKKRPG
jgi:glycosyltransferase involved in cell wall biosynthesis